MREMKFSEKFLKYWGADQEAENRIACAAIIEVFRERRITSRQAADILEISEDDFIELVKRRKIIVFPDGIQEDNDWLDEPEIVDYVMERRKSVQEEIQEGEFMLLDDLREKFGE